MLKHKSRLLPPLVDAMETGIIEFTEWEEQFLSDMDVKGEDYELSDRQVSSLIRIYDKCVRNGELK